MSDALIITGLALAVFAATNLDNLFLLLAFLAQPAARPGTIRLAYLCVIVIVLLASLAASSGASIIPARLTARLGFVPIAFGLWGAIRLWRSAGEEAPVALPPGAGAGALITLTALHSTDSLAVFTALLAETRPALHAFVIAAGIAGALVWVSIAGWVASHERLGSWLRRAAPYLLPPLLIGIGAYILIDTPTDVDP